MANLLLILRLFFPWTSYVKGFAMAQDGDCRILRFKPAMQGYSLQGHVFKTFTVQKESTCEITCFLEHGCMSYNFGPKSQEDGIFICELSDSDHKMNPEVLASRNGFTYRTTENACVQRPCSPNLFCQNGFTNDGYRCVNKTQKSEGFPSEPKTSSEPERVNTPSESTTSRSPSNAISTTPYESTTSRSPPTAISTTSYVPPTTRLTPVGDTITTVPPTTRLTPVGDIIATVSTTSKLSLTGTTASTASPYGQSCKHIRDSGGSRGDEEYWIDPERSGNPLKVFCDMTTDGGGWLLVSNVIMNSSSPMNLSLETTYRGIANYHSNKTVLQKNAMTELRTHLSFTQLRFHCSKQQGRTFHVTTVANIIGEAVVQYFSGQTDVQPNACGSFFKMENDNSRLAGVCNNWGFQDGAYSVGKWGHAKNQDRLYDHPAFAVALYHWLLEPELSRWECDDYLVGVSSGDFWKVFVR